MKYYITILTHSSPVSVVE